MYPIELLELEYLLAFTIGLMGGFSLLANTFIIAFYSKKRRDIVPLLYTVIAAGDIATGSIALCHWRILLEYPIRRMGKFFFLFSVEQPLEDLIFDPLSLSIVS